MTPPANLYDPATLVEPADADAFVAIVFGQTDDEQTRSEPQVWPVAKNQPVTIGDVLFVLTDDGVEYHPDGITDPPAVEIAISTNAAEAEGYDLGGYCLVAVFTDIHEARAWASTIDDIVDGNLPFPMTPPPEADESASTGT